MLRILNDFKEVGVKMFGAYKSNQSTVVLAGINPNTLTHELTLALSQGGYEVRTTENEDHFYQLLMESEPLIILLEAQSTTIDGFKICRQIKAGKRGKRCAVIMVLKQVDEVTIEAVYSCGADDWLTYPISRSDLIHRFDKASQNLGSQRAFDEQSAFSESVVQYAADGIITINGNCEVEYINPAGEKLFGQQLQPSGTLSILQLLPDFTLAEIETAIQENQRHTMPSEILGRHCDGTQIPLEMTLSRFYTQDSCFYNLTLRDLKAQKQYEEKIMQQAFYDALTGLPNRAFLKERINFEIARAKRSHSKFALLYLDLDRFKIINDTLGHETGDQLLKTLSAKLQQTVRTDDLVARMGGDEFVILLPGLFHVELVGKVANKLLDVIKEPYIIDNKRLNVSGSIGITVFPDDAQDYEMLLTYSEIAMYRAKDNGKDGFQAYMPELNARAMERLDLENDLRLAIENQAFEVYYQPKVHTKSMEIVGMEALVRWHHPIHGIISPIHFIPVAEETGLIVPIGTWVLRQACIHNQSLRSEGLPILTVAVNLSMRQFEAQNMVETVLQILEETGMPPDLLELEITESIAVKNTAYTVSVIQTLQKLGIKFSIDDFGTGYSSLSQINHLSVDKLKIDKSFVSPIDGVRENTIIAATVLSLGKNLNMSVIAEGVETQAQVDFFTDNNCDEMQGYFIAKPMPWTQFKELVREQQSKKSLNR